MAVAGDPGVAPFHERSASRHAGQHRDGSQDGYLLGDPGPRGPGGVPTTFRVPDMHRVEKHGGGRRVRDLTGGLEWQETKAPGPVQATQEARGPSAEPAVCVVQNEKSPYPLRSLVVHAANVLLMYSEYRSNNQLLSKARSGMRSPADPCDYPPSPGVCAYADRAGWPPRWA